MTKNSVIRFFAPIYAWKLQGYEQINMPEIVETDLIGKIDDCDDGELTQYFMDYHELPLLIDNTKFINGNFSIEKIRNKVCLVATYHLNEPLTAEEKQELFEFTQGQFSDGAGESFIAELAENYDFNLGNEFMEMEILE